MDSIIRNKLEEYKTQKLIGRHSYNMKHLIYILLVMGAMMLCGCKSKQEMVLGKSWSDYEASTHKIGVSGVKCLKVWGFGPTAKDAVEQAKKNAVHACLFRGVPDSKTPAIFDQQGGEQVLSANYLYFKNFFEGEQSYLQFVSQTTDGAPSGRDRQKVKDGYRVGLYVKVMYDNLRDKMKRDGLLKTSSDMFTY